MFEFMEKLKRERGANAQALNELRKSFALLGGEVESIRVEQRRTRGFEKSSVLGKQVKELEDDLKKFTQDMARELGDQSDRIRQAACSHEEWGWFIQRRDYIDPRDSTGKDYYRECEKCGKKVFIQKREFHEGCRAKAAIELDKLDKIEKEKS